MYNFNTDNYEMKREIINFSDKLSKGTSKANQKFTLDLQYGISASKSVLLSEISRELKEKIPIANTIDRLSINTSQLNEESLNLINDNYLKMVRNNVGEKVLVILDDSDVAKPYGQAFEDLSYVRDGSAIDNKQVLGYNICESVVVSKNQKQPISLYSEVYSTISKGFKSKNTYSMESIKVSQKVLSGKQVTYVADRGYDANWFLNTFLNKSKNDKFVLRIRKNRKLIFKNKSKNAYSVALKRKGKVRMDLQFTDYKEKIVTYVSHTRVKLPAFLHKTVYLVIVYGLSEKHPMLLLTNKEIKDKKDVISVVRDYMSRWRIEEYFRFKKQEYGFEGFRVRSLHSIKVINKMLTYHIGMIGLIADKLNKKLLGLKIIERSKSIKSKVTIWYYQISRGIAEILSYSQVGIAIKYKNRKPPDYVQSQLAF